MASGKVFLITLCSLMLLSQLIIPAHSCNCCLKYTRRHLPCKRLLSYKFQDIKHNCDINAVIFRQSNGKLVCANPLLDHTQKCIKHVE
uniref:C-C motif chemokine n=1 Tax=Neogobius melanostomus TaxID=47308 RepID=A0A8C6UXC5_9GOBI